MSGDRRYFADQWQAGAGIEDGCRCFLHFVVEDIYFADVDDPELVMLLDETEYEACTVVAVQLPAVGGRQYCFLEETGPYYLGRRSSDRATLVVAPEGVSLGSVDLHLNIGVVGQELDHELVLLVGL